MKILNQWIVLFLALEGLLGTPNIKGVVKNKDTNQPVVGANVEVLETQIGTFSDKEGSFFIKVEINYPVRIKVTHIAYETRELEISSDEIITVFLVPAVIKGQEIEVLGARAKYESDVSSSVNIVKIEEIEIQGARDVGSALRRVSSVKMDFSSSGKQTISIRGSNASDATVLLDGVRLNDANTGIADLSAIDLNTIEQIQVIKGGNTTLFGSGAMGGVLNLQSKGATKNSLYIHGGQGVSYNHDWDLSFGGTGVVGPLGAGVRYSGKSRSYAGRTVTTHIFQNIFGALTLPNGKIDIKGFRFDKTLTFPSGGVRSADQQSLASAKYSGSLFGMSGWEATIGWREWGMTQDFFTSLNETLEDRSLSTQISKHFAFRNFETTLQLEREDQQFSGNKRYLDFSGNPSVKHRADMQRMTNAMALASRWAIIGDHPNIDLITFEIGLRLNQIGTLRNETFEFPSIMQDGSPMTYVKPISLSVAPISSKRIGTKVEGRLAKISYSLFINQGNNRRLPMLSDYFHFVSTGLEGRTDSTLTSESISTTEVNLTLKLYDLEQLPFVSALDLDMGYFRNNYSNKIAYWIVEDLPPIPFNSTAADIRGVEATLRFQFWENRFAFSASTTYLNVSNPLVFPYKPEYRHVLAGEVNLGWLIISYDNVVEGEQYYYIPGFGEGILKPRSNANINMTFKKKVFGLNWMLSYTIRNILSRKELDLSIEESLRRGFNYFERYREILTLKIEL